MRTLLLTAALLLSFNSFATNGSAAKTMENNARAFKDETVIPTVTAIAKGFGFSGDTLCYDFEYNKFKVMQNKWFLEKTGSIILDQYNQGNPEAANIMDAWAKNLKNPKPNDFAENWTDYWSTELTIGFKTLRCNRYGSNFSNRLQQTGEFAINNGLPNWFTNFDKMVSSFQKK